MQLEIPRAFQDLLKPARYKIYYGGRGAAKSKTFGIVLLTLGMTKKLGILCARELQVSIADSVHSLLSQLIDAMPAFKAFYRVTNKEIVGLNGTFFIFKGLKHNISEIKSTEGINICWVEEAQAVSDKSWETLIPTIREEDSEIWASFNTKHPTDPTYQRFVMKQRDNAIVHKVSWRDNPFFPKVLDDERLQLLKDDQEAYDHVWEGEFDTRYSGAVYAKHIRQNQIVDDLKYDPRLPLYTAWDLGYDDATAVTFFQLARGEIRVIDYYESNFEDIKHYCEVLYGAEINVLERDQKTGRVKQWEFGERIDEVRSAYDYTGGKHYVPHDAAYKLQAAAGRSIVDQSKEYGIAMTVVGATNQQSSEQALRKALPHCWFNRDKTRDLVHALMSYHYEYDEDRKIYKPKPVHDWSSHGVDSAEIMARMWTDKGLTTEQVKVNQRRESFMALQRKIGKIHNDPYQLSRSDKRRI